MNSKLLWGIFIFAIAVRFLYFPNDINFAYDQARDAFVSARLASGDLVTIGPPSTFEGLHHGALIYYILAPLYAISRGNPEYVSLVFRVINALGVFLIFAIARDMFSKRTALVSAFIYAVSFEQTQIALFLGHPALVNIAILIFIFGLTKLFVKRKATGLYFVAAGLALALQFHISMIVFLMTIPFVFVWIYKNSDQYNKLLRVTPQYSQTSSSTSLNFFNSSSDKSEVFLKKYKKTILYSTGIALIVLSTYLLAELKFGFSNLHAVVNYLRTPKGTYPSTPIIIVMRYIRHNFINISSVATATLIVLIAFSTKQLNGKYKSSVLILCSVIILACFGYLSEDPALPRYTFAMGASVSLIILLSFLVQKLSPVLITISVTVIFISNINLIKTYNTMGNIPEVNAQAYYLLSDEKRILDTIYTDAGGPFSISALTIPYKINTTWSYLFEWYGQKNYGYLPTWAGENALGYEGNLKVQPSRSKLTYPLYVIIEPTRGLPEKLVNEYTKEEDLFTKVVWEKRIGKFILLKRLPL